MMRRWSDLALLAAIVSVAAACMIQLSESFSVYPPMNSGIKRDQRKSHILLASSKPLYDGTNYTFPDTTTPAGIAEVLEVSFVNACMQLRTGYVDILKMFIASATAGYELGFPLQELENALENCSTQTAGRPLMPEEIEIRRTWIALVYLTLKAVQHVSLAKDAVGAIPGDIQSQYAEISDILASSYARGTLLDPKELLSREESGHLSPVDLALRSQNLRVMSLTLTVREEAEDARPGGGGPMPPTPPIPGAFS